MSPVLELLNGAGNITKDNMAAAVIKVSGLMCNEGSQKGRILDTFQKTVNVKPLFLESTINGTISYSTLSSTAGRAVEIPTLADVAVSSDAFIELSGFPAGISPSDFTVSSSGTKILLTSYSEYCSQDFGGTVTVSGIKSPDSQTGYTRAFTIAFGLSVSSSDSLNVSPDTAVNYAMKSLVAKVNAANSTLDVTLNFDGNAAGWKNDRIIIYVDDANIAETTSDFKTGEAWNNYAAATYTSTDASVCKNNASLFPRRKQRCCYKLCKEYCQC